MVKNLFTKALKEFLEDRIDSVIFEEVSREYALKNQKVNEIEKSLQSLLEMADTPNGTANVKKLFMDLRNGNGDLTGLASEIAYQKGFSEGIKFIIYSLIMN